MSTDAARTKLRELIATKQQWLRQWQAPELLSPGRSDMIHILSDNIAELQQVLAELDKAEPQEPVVKWGVDWGVNGDRSCVSIIKKHPDGVLEVVAVEYGPEGSAPPPSKKHSYDKDPQGCYEGQ